MDWLYNVESFGALVSVVISFIILIVQNVHYMFPISLGLGFVGYFTKEHPMLLWVFYTIHTGMLVVILVLWNVNGLFVSLLINTCLCLCMSMFRVNRMYKSLNLPEHAQLI